MIDQEEREGLIEDLEAEIRNKENRIVELTNEINETQTKLSELEDHAAGLISDRKSVIAKLANDRDKLKDLQEHGKV